jgi:hypothetical protein
MFPFTRAAGTDERTDGGRWRGWRGRVPEGRWGEGRQQVAVPAMVSNKGDLLTRGTDSRAPASWVTLSFDSRPSCPSFWGGGSHDAATQCTRAKAPSFQRSSLPFWWKWVFPGRGGGKAGSFFTRVLTYYYVSTYYLACFYYHFWLLIELWTWWKIWEALARYGWINWMGWMTSLFFLFFCSLLFIIMALPSKLGNAKIIGPSGTQK